MRIFLGILVTLLASVGTVGDVNSRITKAEATILQATPSTNPKCIVPPEPVGGCHVSKKDKDFIRWQAPDNEDMYVCFTTRLFKKQTYHIRAGHHEDSGPIDIKPEPTSGTIFQYYYGPNPCPPEKVRNTARVIVDD